MSRGQPVRYSYPGTSHLLSAGSSFLSVDFMILHRSPQGDGVSLDVNLESGGLILQSDYTVILFCLTV